MDAIYVSVRHDRRGRHDRGTIAADASVARAVAQRASTDITDAEEFFCRLWCDGDASRRYERALRRR